MDWRFKQITLPAYATLPGYGTLTMIVALVGKADGDQSSSFDLAFRYISDADFNSRMFDYQVTATGIDNVANAFDLYYGSSISSTACDTNSIEITFNNNRREWISSIDMQIGSTQTSNFPTSFVVKGKNDGDSDWTTIRTIDGFYFTEAGERQTFYMIDNDNAYNKYKLENIITGDSSDCSWQLTHIDLSSSKYDVFGMRSLSYYYDKSFMFTSGEFGKGSFQNLYFYDFSINPALPEGLHINKQTGVIYGTTNTPMARTSYTVTAHVSPTNT